MSVRREHDLPDGGLAVSRHWTWGVKDAVTVPKEDRALYELLTRVLDETSVPSTMPARLAVACSDLVDARDTVSDIERGRCGIAGASYGLSYLHTARDGIDDHRDRAPITLVAVGCSGSKHDPEGAVPARELYRGAYWSCKRQYGQTVGDQWRIVSAQHALLDPGREIEPYERTPGDLDGIPVDHDGRLPNGDPVRTLLDRWAFDVHNGLARWLDEVAGGVDPRDVRLEVLLGRSYRDPLEQRGVFDALRTRGTLEVAFPFQSEEQAQGGNGNQMGWMTDRVSELETEASA